MFLIIKEKSLLERNINIDINEKLLLTEDLLELNFISLNEYDKNLISFIKKANDYYKDMKFNLIIASLMSFVNICYKIIQNKDQLNNKIKQTFLINFIKLLNPIAPHFSQEI